MKNRLCIGIQQRSAAWNALLNQLGVCFETVDYGRDLLQGYSVIILNQKPNKDQAPVLKRFVASGGSLLQITNKGPFVNKNHLQATFVKTLINDSEAPAFSHIGHVDLYRKIWLNNQSSLFEGLIHFYAAQEGSIAFFGADAAACMQSEGFSRKRFFSKDGDEPDELVSKVSKHELSEVFKSVLKELHFLRALPYIEKWTSPTKDPVFCFRIDSDFGDQSSMDELYSAFRKHHKKATWFLHVEAHEEWLEHFHHYKQQEIALHGYRHGTSGSYKKTLSNITKGREALNQAGFAVNGYCAPYGIWNNALKKAYKDLEFSYSSEFTFSYDGFPVQPSEERLPLQISIHPVCTGSLNRRNYSPQQMKGYFKQVLDSKLARFEPVLFYHHPLQPGIEVIDQILIWADQFKLENLTFSEYANFWKTREQFSYIAELNEGKIQISQSTDPEKWLQVSMNHTEFDLVNSGQNVVDLGKSSKLKYSKPYLPASDKVAAMRRKDIKLLKTSLLDWKNRIQL